MKIKLPYGNIIENDQLVLPNGQFTMDVEGKSLRLHDGVTVGGVELTGRRAYYATRFVMESGFDHPFTGVNDYIYDLDINISNVQMAVGRYGKISVSTDGINWSSLAHPSSSGTVKHVKFFKGYWYIGGAVPLVRSNNNGNTWSTTGNSGDFGITSNAVATDGNTLVFAGGAATTPRLMASTDGLTWVGADTKLPSAVQRVEYADGIWVASGGYKGEGTHLSYSTDALNWTLAHSDPNGEFVQALVHTPAGWLAILDDGNTMKSTDGVVWTAGDPFAISATGINAFGQGGGVVVGVYMEGSSQSRIKWTLDGINWTLDSTLLPINYTQSVTYHDGIFTLVGWGGDKLLTLHFIA